jgi:cobalt/nickel transport system permease protein
MHVPDGLIITNKPLSVFGVIAMWIISLAFLYWSWKKAKHNYSQSITALLGISSAFVFAAQMINFPIIFGTIGHLVGYFACNFAWSLRCNFGDDYCFNYVSSDFC